MVECVWLDEGDMVITEESFSTFMNLLNFIEEKNLGLEFKTWETKKKLE